MSATQNLVVFDDINEVEDTFLGDDESTTVDDSPIYEDNHWPKENPNGFSFKGKKPAFVKVCETIKILLRKGNEKVLDNISFKVMDMTKSAYGVDYEIEIVKEKEKGIALLKIFGPNSKKGYTFTINKSKNFEAKFAQILALDIVKKLLDRFGSEGDGWIDVVKAVPKAYKIGETKKPFYCHFCGNGFSNTKI